MMSKVFDFIGVGVGPFNLSLACLANPIGGLNGVFFDKKERFNWHPGMLLQDATLQIPFMADMVTLPEALSSVGFRCVGLPWSTAVNAKMENDRADKDRPRIQVVDYAYKSNTLPHTNLVDSAPIVISGV